MIKIDEVSSGDRNDYINKQIKILEKFNKQEYIKTMEKHIKEANNITENNNTFFSYLNTFWHILAHCLRQCIGAGFAVIRAQSILFLKKKLRA